MFVSLKQAPVRNRNSRTGDELGSPSRILELLGFSLKTIVSSPWQRECSGTWLALKRLT